METIKVSVYKIKNGSVINKRKSCILPMKNSANNYKSNVNKQQTQYKSIDYILKNSFNRKMNHSALGSTLPTTIGNVTSFKIENNNIKTNNTLCNDKCAEFRQNHVASTASINLL